MSVARPVAREAVARVPALPPRELQELWFATRRRDWRTLVVVPAAPGQSALPIAKALGEVGGFIRMNPVRVINAEGLDLARIASLVMDMAGNDAAPVWTVNTPGGGGPAREAASRDATIVALDSVVANPLALPVALAADAVLICVALGKTEVAAARHTVELVGRDRVIGCALIRT
ncbi:MAG TPA: hypothetical protein VMK66_14600 [Myxococcales bacterium]|nr:hypothetical protein [Myxococcales bacterium]